MGCGTCSGGCTADGTRINPADYRGKAVLLAFGLPGVAGGRLESNDALGKQYNLRQGGKNCFVSPQRDEQGRFRSSHTSIVTLTFRCFMDGLKAAS
jgi:hypothetical protein